MVLGVVGWEASEDEEVEGEDGEGADAEGVDDRKGEDEGVDVGDDEDRGDRWKGRIRLYPGTPSFTTGPWRISGPEKVP
jgi:hypothetical protein